MASVRYFGGLWMTFNEELQDQISVCLQTTYICIIYTSHEKKRKKKEKWTHNTGEMPWNQGDHSSDVAIYFLF